MFVAICLGIGALCPIRHDGRRQWEGLTRGRAADATRRSAHDREKVDQSEHLAVVAGETLLPGVAVAREMVARGADRAWCAENWFGVCPDVDGRRIEPDQDLIRVLQLLRDPVSGSLAGLPDAVGIRGNAVLLYDVKLSGGRDRLSPTQHALARRLERSSARTSNWPLSSGTPNPRPRRNASAGHNSKSTAKRRVRRPVRRLFDGRTRSSAGISRAMACHFAGRGVSLIRSETEEENRVGQPCERDSPHRARDDRRHPRTVEPMGDLSRFSIEDLTPDEEAEFFRILEEA